MLQVIEANYDVRFLRIVSYCCHWLRTLCLMGVCSIRDHHKERNPRRGDL